jgi:hypothetical protein
MSPLGGYMYSHAPVKPMSTRQVSILPNLFSPSDIDGSISIFAITQIFLVFSAGVQRWR